MLSAPSSTAPAASSRSISVASRTAGARLRLIFDPARVASPAISNRFFTAKGTPARGPTFRPAAIAASTAPAFARARSAVTSVKELRMVSCCLIRASADSTISSADTLRPATAPAIAAAEVGACARPVAKSGCKDTGRLGFVGQRELVHQPRESERYLKIRSHGRFPGRIDRQAQDL